ncbi:helix-turn-helix domain-containing protein [Alkalinema pantanalense CENA528]|uniref:helix-turn-helix domain-containing protein n=1 Tax=Alkalinema pantanalense TaxID=1620705 RepID=UPI003D6DEE48
MELRPIRTDADYQTALKEIEQLFDAAPDTPEFDRLDILSTLVEAYEKTIYPIDLPDPIEAIQYYMETREWSRRDLESCIGSRARVSEILSRKRSLTLDMIRKLHDQLGIPAEVLIRPYESLQSPA